MHPRKHIYSTKSVLKFLFLLLVKHANKKIDTLLWHTIFEEDGNFKISFWFSSMGAKSVFTIMRRKVARRLEARSVHLIITRKKKLGDIPMKLFVGKGCSLYLLLFFLFLLILKNLKGLFSSSITRNEP